MSEEATPLPLRFVDRMDLFVGHARYGKRIAWLINSAEERERTKSNVRQRMEDKRLAFKEVSDGFSFNCGGSLRFPVSPGYQGMEITRAWINEATRPKAPTQ